MFRREEAGNRDTPHLAVNRLLATLPAEETNALLSRAERFQLSSGDWANDARGEPMLWLPESAVLSFGETLGGRLVECGIVGREGAIGWEPVTGRAPVRQPVGVLIGGSALAIAADQVAALCDGRPRLAALFLRYRETMVTQLRTTIATRMQCRPDARLARWLCMLHDRVEGDTLDITHLRLSAFLNARRASVTDCLHVLEGDRIVRCTRGKILIRDRQALERATAGSYGAAEDAHRTLVGPFGRGDG